MMPEVRTDHFCLCCIIILSVDFIKATFPLVCIPSTFSATTPA